MSKNISGKGGGVKGELATATAEPPSFRDSIILTRSFFENFNNSNPLCVLFGELRTDFGLCKFSVKYHIIGKVVHNIYIYFYFKRRPRLKITGRASKSFKLCCKQDKRTEVKKMFNWKIKLQFKKKISHRTEQTKKIPPLTHVSLILIKPFPIS